VSAQISEKVVRIAVAAITSGIATAGNVPKTKSRITSAPSPPMSVSVRTLGPELELSEL
jgi:hypothetical protein